MRVLQPSQISSITIQVHIAKIVASKPLSNFLPDPNANRTELVTVKKGMIKIVIPEEANALRRHQRRYRPPQPPAIQTLLRQAYQLNKELVTAPEITRNNLARRAGVNPSYLTRILNLLKLAPEIQRYILAMPPSEFQSPISERRVQRLARNPVRSYQISEFDKLKVLNARARIPSPRPPNHFLFNGNLVAFPIDIGSGYFPAVKELN